MRIFLTGVSPARSVVGRASLRSPCADDVRREGDLNALRRLLPRVAMMQSAQARTGNHSRARRQFLIHWPTIRGVLAEAVVNPIFVKAGNVLPDEAPQVRFVQRDHVVQHLAPTATHPSFRDSILPGRSDTRPFGFQTGGFQELDDIRVELRVAVQHRVTEGASVGKALPQLLDDPLRRVSGHVEVQDVATSVRDDEEVVEQMEGHRRHGEEIERNDHLPVIGEEGQPPLTRIATAPNSSQISSDTPFGYHEAELLKLFVDFGGSLIRVLFRQASDQNTNLISDLRSAAAGPGTPPPVETKIGAVPVCWFSLKWRGGALR